MVAEAQPRLEIGRLDAWAVKRGLSLTLFHGWAGFVDQALFWSDLPKLDGAAEAAARIRERLVAVEAAPEAVELWQRLTTDV